jgi:hypothetical protein
MPLQATSGAASYDAFGGGVPVVPSYIEEVFSTYLYTGNNSTQTITNGIDLSTKGGLVWVKNRTGAYHHTLWDTVRGVQKYLYTSATNTESTDAGSLTAFNSNGFSLGNSDQNWNNSASSYVSWTFRKQPKFFDVVTFTGDGRTSGSATINHNLGATPAVIIIKQVNDTGNWQYGTNFGSSNWLSLFLNLTDAGTTTTYANNDWFAAQPTSTTFTVGFPYYGSGQQYVAYLFASNAGGFGLTGTDNVISCGSLTADGSGNSTVTLGYEPQWIIAKPSSEAGSWRIYDSMRGMNLSRTLFLNANNSDAEGDSNAGFIPNATGFTTNAQLTNPSATYIYIAIRRGPMKVPTSGTSVYQGVARTGTGAIASITAGFAPDMALFCNRDASYSSQKRIVDKLRGTPKYLITQFTNAEASDTTQITAFTNTGVTLGDDSTEGNINASGYGYINWMFKRAPSFFDEVCYTGTGSATTITHNLGVVPEMIIVKPRSVTSNWQVFHKDLNALGTETPDDSRIRLNSDAAATANNVIWNSTLPTSTVFSVGASSDSNGSGNTLVAYLFATCAGVSKVFSYTGNGSSQTINCGFTSSARFVLIKRTDDVGDWYVWDSARGIVSGNDPHLSLNTTAAEVTTDDTIDTDSTGFIVNQVSATNVNVTDATYIGLAIA